MRGTGWLGKAVFAAGLAASAGLAVAQGGEPIALDPGNPHYFRFQGRTIALIGSGEHYGAVLNPAVDGAVYLRTIHADGLDYTRLFGGSYVEVPEKSFGILRNDLAPEPGMLVAPWARSGELGYAGGGNKFDLSRWNPEYFTRLHAFLGEAERLGIVVELTLFSSQYGEPQWALSPFNGSNNVNGAGLADWKKLETLENGSILGWQERYVRKLVHEAAAYGNVIFEIQNEPWSDRPMEVDEINPYLFTGRDQYPNSVEVADAASTAWQARVASWIADEEKGLPHKHLIAQNYTNFRLPVRSLAPGVSVVNFHYAYPEAVSWNYGLGQALSYDETGFLGHGDAAYLRQAWNFMLAGGSTFDHLDYSFTPGHSDGADTEANGPGGGSPALRRELGVLAGFLGELPLEKMRPDAETVVHTAGAVARVLAEPGQLWAIYLDDGALDRAENDDPAGGGAAAERATAGIEVTLSLPAGRYTGAWIDVRSGAVVRREKFTHAGGQRVLQSPPFAGGIALRLKRQ